MPGTFSQLIYHIVFSTKHREPLITPQLRERLYPFIGGIVRDERGSLMAIGGIEDHVHLLVRWRTDATVADLLRNVKARSSLWVHQEFPKVRSFAWQEGYSAFTVSKSGEQDVRGYIGGQEEHHKRFDFKTELLELLRRHEIEFDLKYVFD